MIYIGSTMLTPRRRASLGYHGSKKFNEAIEKYGMDRFKLDILWEIQNENKPDLKNDLLLLENIETSSQMSNVEGVGYNVHAGSHREMTDETKKKISMALTGRKVTWGDKIGASNKGKHPNRANKPLSKATRLKMSAAKVGKTGYWKGRKRPKSDKNELSLAIARHIRWHKNRNICNNTCAQCINGV